MSFEPSTKYCRGCNQEVADEDFGDYKQCGECRLKATTRKRQSVTCLCGRTLLACSLKVHLRSIYHAEHVKPAPQAVPQAKKQPRTQVRPPPAQIGLGRIAIIAAPLAKPVIQALKLPQSRPQLKVAQR
jgi:hypothetical protein